MSELAKRFHENWLGLVQPIEGLVVSVPVLVESDCMNTDGSKLQTQLQEICPVVDVDSGARSIASLPRLFADILELTHDLFDVGDDLPQELELWVAEAGEAIRPTMALKRLSPATKTEDGLKSEETPASKAGESYLALVLQIDDGQAFDKAGPDSGGWDYPPANKFERLLRECRVPIGLLSNGRAIRLIYAPHGESSGSITFRVDDMCSIGGRPILDAFHMLLHDQRIYNAPEEKDRLPGILERSRKHQAGVTNTLADQVFEAVQFLLDGLEAAAERDGDGLIREALEREDDHLYEGILTVLLRLVFVLYAEDRELLPTDNALYAKNLSLTALFDQLQEDHNAYPDSMSRRFGAWGRLLALFRAVYLGSDHGELKMPPRYGDLFDPHRFPFLEGWGPGGSAPITQLDARGDVRVPTVDDDTVYRVLERLMILQGQRLSYRALDVEQVGAVYEALMGYHVQRVAAAAVCLRPERVWVSVEDIQAQKPAQLSKWLKEEGGLAKSAAGKLAKQIKAAESDEEITEALLNYRIKNSDQVPAGKLVIQPGEERRRTSSHYTPRSLSAPIVKRTLDPLIKAMGDTPSSEQLLDLVICDPAMGSGAFLVEACRYLGDQVVAAWTREERIDKIADRYESVENHARRLVAQRCLYGVDKNPFAVSLARLSLWLITLSKTHPFSFLDHALRCGDSLVGLDLEQIKAFHWEPSDQISFLEKELDRAFEEAFEDRRRILEMAREDAEHGHADKARLLRSADDAMDRVRLVGDLVIGAFFSSTKNKERELERVRRLELVEAWFASDEPGVPEELGGLRAELLEKQAAFHWMVEFPEVFAETRADPLATDAASEEAFVDAFIGNPPFAGKNNINDFGGAGYLDWLKTIHEGAHGNADYSAHFFRRADDLIGTHGTIGLIATNTIAQGDTRASGLQPLVQAGCQIYNATQDLPWPGEAAVTVAVVHIAKGSPTFEPGSLVLNGVLAPAINSRLRPTPERKDPTTLVANAGRAFVGTIVLGMGFTLTPEERARLVERDAANAERIQPYIGGQEVNTDPQQSFDRYVINFGDITLEATERWPDLVKIVREKVKPGRDTLKDNADGRRRKKFWWQFGRDTPALYEAIAGLPRCLVTARVSKHLMFCFQPTELVFSEQLYVFPLHDARAFAVVQSRLHEKWARLLSSSMKTDLRYAASDCFATFPFPKPDPRSEIPSLEAIGEKLYEARATWMKENDLGLTKLYNALKDADVTTPEIEHLRELHIEMDRAVIEAYGWDNIDVPPFTDPKSPAEEAAHQAFEDEIIDRLFVLNAERAEEEEKQGLSTKKSKKKSRKKRKTKKTTKTKDQADLALE